MLQKIKHTHPFEAFVQMSGLISTFEAEGVKIIGHFSRSFTTKQRRWNSSFGTSPAIAAQLWEWIDPDNSMPRGVRHCHLLWALYFLKTYPTEEPGSGSVGGYNEKTWRKWVKLFVTAISYLECRVVSSFLFAHW